MDNFTAKDICAIIKACSQNSVKSLKLGEIEICLETAPDYQVNLGYYPEQEVADGGMESPEPRVELTKEQEQDLAYARSQELLFTDPTAFEESFLIDESQASINDEAENDQEY